MSTQDIIIYLSALATIGFLTGSITYYLIARHEARELDKDILKAEAQTADLFARVYDLSDRADELVVTQAGISDSLDGLETGEWTTYRQ